jgi:Na+-driven multidrug efflux pump
VEFAVSDGQGSTKKPFFLGMAAGIVCGLALGSTLAAIFGDDVVVLVQKLAKRIVGERDEPNFEILLQ